MIRKKKAPAEFLFILLEKNADGVPAITGIWRAESPEVNEEMVLDRQAKEMGMDRDTYDLAHLPAIKVIELSEIQKV